MCAFDRPTVRRVARCSAMRIRVLRARRIRGSTLYLLLIWSPSDKSKNLLLSDLVSLESPASVGKCADDSRQKIRSISLFLLRFLDHHALVEVTHTLALVRLGRTIRTNLGGNLTHLLLVDAFDQDFGLHRRFHLHAFRHRMDDR